MVAPLEWNPYRIQGDSFPYGEMEVKTPVFSPRGLVDIKDSLEVAAKDDGHLYGRWTNLERSRATEPICHVLAEEIAQNLRNIRLQGALGYLY